MTLIKILNEKAPLEFSKFANVISDIIVNSVPVDEMRASRGKDFDSTKFYQIRVKPRTKDMEISDTLNLISKYLTSSESKKMGISEVQINPRSRNSSKFSSVSFHFNNMDYDIVVAAGSNNGQNFEKDLLLKMDNLVAGIDSSKEAEAAFAALELIDPIFKRSNIKGVAPRTGPTQRSGDLSPEETGKIIADIIISLKKGEDQYISVKNNSGATIANFGISKAINQDLTIDTSSVEWKSWIAPLGLDPKKIENGLKAYESGEEIDFNDVESPNKKITKTSPVFKLLQKLWGSDYYYLREKGSTFIAFKVDRDYVDNKLLKDLTISEIKYPSSSRKQVTILLTSSTKKFKIELRNSQGKIRPTELKFSVAGDIK